MHNDSSMIFNSILILQNENEDISNSAVSLARVGMGSARRHDALAYPAYHILHIICHFRVGHHHIRAGI